MEKLRVFSMGILEVGQRAAYLGQSALECNPGC
jgi:hypothetical protein